MQPNRSSPLYRIRYALEALLALVFFAFCRLLPLDTASAMGGWLGRTLGPRHRAHRVARRNLELIFPAMPEEEKRRTLNAMWDNLGRVVCEYPHLASDKMSSRIRIVGQEHLQAAQARGRPLLFISGHFANWKLGPKAAFLSGVPLVMAYRPANNPLFDAIIRHFRSPFYESMAPKGVSAARELVRSLQQGKALAVMVDQKLNKGIGVPFLGMEAMTSTLVADLALTYDVAMIPGYIVREKGAHFTAYMYPEILCEHTGDWDKDVRKVMEDVNALFSVWVRNIPSQWFLVHKRWATSLYDNK